MLNSCFISQNFPSIIRVVIAASLNVSHPWPSLLLFRVLLPLIINNSRFPLKFCAGNWRAASQTGRAPIFRAQNLKRKHKKQTMRRKMCEEIDTFSDICKWKQMVGERETQTSRTHSLFRLWVSCRFTIFFLVSLKNFDGNIVTYQLVWLFITPIRQRDSDSHL